jgi:hypothetical protein
LYASKSCLPKSHVEPLPMQGRGVFFQLSIATEGRHSLIRKDVVSHLSRRSVFLEDIVMLLYKLAGTTAAVCYVALLTVGIVVDSSPFRAQLNSIFRAKLFPCRRGKLLLRAFSTTQGGIIT